MMLGPYLAVAIGLLVLVGCGNPAPDLPVTGMATGSANMPRADLAVRPPGGPAPTQIALLDPTTRPVSTPDTGSSAVSRAGNPTPGGHVPSAAASPDPGPSDLRGYADQAQREARQQWLAELRESSVATVRLQALELWAAHPDDDLDPLFEALEDDDEQVRTRAEDLWEAQLLQEEAGEQAEE